MKRTLIFLALAACLAAAAAAGDNLIPVKIYINAHDDVYKFRSLGVSIDELRDGYIEARVTRAKFDELTKLGWKAEHRVIERLDPKIAEQYHSYAQMTDFLDSIHTLYPAITKKISIGQSVQARELWAFCVAKNPDSIANRAEVRFAGNIHGIEREGVEMCLGMIDSLTKAYATVPEINSLVNSREIWFLPMFNPDGNYAGTYDNANGVQLNRNYPVPDGSIGGDGTYDMEPETQSMINWENAKRFVAGCMYHSGAQIVNYQWDFSDSVTFPLPDSRLIRQVSLGYSMLNSAIYNTPNPYFPEGVVFGYYWYPAPGSLQDWSYHANSCVDLTIEISNSQPAPSSELPQIWADNRDAMLYLIKQSGWGVQGVVTDFGTGLPINRAQVDAGGIAKSVYTDSLAGDYHRMLMTGNYDLTFSKTGYTSRTFSNVRVRLDSVTNLNVALFPHVLATLSGTVTDSAAGTPLPGAIVQVVGVKSDTTDVGGNYSIQPYQEYYTVLVTAPDYMPKTIDSVLVIGSTTLNVALAPLKQFNYASYDTTPIPTSGAWIADSIYIDRNVTIYDYKVYVNISHTYKGDLVVRLFHPNGIDSIRLHQRSGGSANNIIGWFPDTLKPADSLRWTALYGLNAKGWWKLRIKDYFVPADSGNLNNWAVRIYSTQTGVADQPVERPLPLANQLFCSRPNPLTDRTMISCQLNSPGRMRLKVYNAAGQLVRTLADGYQSAGRHSLFWDGRDSWGERVAAGVYLYRLDAGSFSAVNKLVVVR